MEDTPSNGDNVTDIKKVANKNKTKTKENGDKKEEKKDKFAQIEKSLSDWMLGGELRFAENSPPFRQKFIAHRQAAEEHGFVFEVSKEKTVQIVSVSHVAEALYRRVRNFGGNDHPSDMYGLTYRKSREVAEAYMSIADRLDSWPLPLSWKSTQGLAFSRMSFDPQTLDREKLARHAPIFWRFMERMSNDVAFCQRLGSLFDPNAERKQVAWIFGGSDGGKSMLAWLIQELLLNGQVAHISAAAMRGAHWKAPIVGKRVVIGLEASPKILNSDEFKELTGDGLQSINEKNQPIRMAKIDAVAFFFSNDAPVIRNDEALRNRIIACELPSIESAQRMPEQLVKNRLAEELPVILSYCWTVYQDVKGRRIPCDQTALDQGIAEYESDHEGLFERLFVMGGSMSGGEFHRVLSDVAGIKQRSERDSFRKFLETAKGMRRQRKKDGYVFTGVRPKADNYGI